MSIVPAHACNPWGGNLVSTKAFPLYVSAESPRSSAGVETWFPRQLGPDSGATAAAPRSPREGASCVRAMFRSSTSSNAHSAPRSVHHG